MNHFQYKKLSAPKHKKIRLLSERFIYYLIYSLIKMLTEEFRGRLMQMIRENPKEAIKELEKNPRILDVLLNSHDELKKKQEEIRNEHIKYVNMTRHMQAQLKEQAEKLNTTQGLLIGAGVLILLSLLEND